MSLRRPVNPLAADVRALRCEAGLSKAELGRRLGITPRQLAKLENPASDPTIGLLAKVARTLGYDLLLALKPRGSR